MSEKWLGIIVSGEKVTAVQLRFTDENPAELLDDTSWKLQQGDPACAYYEMYRTISNYVAENAISHVVVKGSATNSGRAGLAHLHSAELRGVVISGAASSAPHVTVWTKAKVSKNVGKRNVDAYVADPDFWKKMLDSLDLSATGREAALQVLVVRRHGK